MGKVYAIREDPASKNVRYFKLLTFRGSARVAEREYTFLVCSDLNGTLTVWGTPTSLNATVFEPSEVKSRGFTATKRTVHHNTGQRVADDGRAIRLS